MSAEEYEDPYDRVHDGGLTDAETEEAIERIWGSTEDPLGRIGTHGKPTSRVYQDYDRNNADGDEPYGLHGNAGNLTG